MAEHNEALRALAELAEAAMGIARNMAGGMRDDNGDNEGHMADCQMLARAGSLSLFANADVNLRDDGEMQRAYKQTLAAIMMCAAFCLAFVDTVSKAEERAELSNKEQVNNLLKELGLD